MMEGNIDSATNSEGSSGGAGKIVGITLGIIVGLILICALLACVVIAVLTLLGPTVGNIFPENAGFLEIVPTYTATTMEF